MSANWSVVAAREVDDAVRSRLLWGLVAVVALMAGLATAVPRLLPGEVTALVGVGAASEFASGLVPIVALVAAYLAIAGERESGSLRVLLGLEPDRGTVVLGKFIGRSAVVAGGVAGGFAVAGVAAYAMYGDLPVVAFLAVLALTAALGVTFVGIAVGISAATATRARAMTLGIGAYLALALLWDLVPQGLYLLTEGTMPDGPVPAWFLLVQGLSPSGAYGALVTTVLGAGDPSVPGLAAATGGGPLPVYLSWWVFALVLVAWTALPLAAGAWRFGRADLN